MAAIETRDLVKEYRNWPSRRRTRALNGVSLEVPEGCIFGLLGPNGAGKTTLVKCLLTICPADRGSALIFGQPCEAPQTRRRVGYLPEGHVFPAHMTALGMLDYSGGLAGMSRRERRRRAFELLALTGLSQWGRTAARKFSKGMQQRLGLAQALLADPELVILDEPTDGIDPVGRVEVRELLKELRAKGKTVFLNSHLLSEVEQVADVVAVMDHGRILKVGRPEEIAETQAKYRFQVEGMDETAFRELGVRGGGIEPIPGGFLLKTDELPVLNQVIDWLRARGVTIREVALMRESLEERFLQLVRGARGPEREAEQSGAG